MSQSPLITQTRRVEVATADASPESDAPSPDATPLGATVTPPEHVGQGYPARFQRDSHFCLLLPAQNLTKTHGFLSQIKLCF